MNDKITADENEWECPADVITGKLGYQIVYWDESLECWNHWGFTTTEKGAETKRLRAKSKGCQHVRIFQLTEIVK